MVHINVSKNKKGQKQFRVVEVSDKNGKVIGAETKLNSKPAAWKNVLAKLRLYNNNVLGSVYVQDNTVSKPKVYAFFEDGTKAISNRALQTIKK